MLGSLLHVFNEIERGEVALEGKGVGLAVGGEAGRNEIVYHGDE
jgi:hypothetical protein